MPCQLCLKVFKALPCKGEEYSLKVNECDFGLTPINVRQMDIRYRNLFYRLKEKCPCNECIVKVICSNGRLDCIPWIKGDWS